jgi:hypothetical protein
MTDFDKQPFLYAAVALAIAGFDAPIQPGFEPASADEAFECVYSLDEGLNLAVAYWPEAGQFQIELQWAQASAATQAAVLALARAVPDLRCTQAADGQTLCLARAVAWDPRIPPDEMAAVVAEMAAAGVELAQAGHRVPGDPEALQSAPSGAIRG